MLFQIMRGIRLFLKLNYVLSTYPNISIIAFGPTVLICVITSGLPPLFNAYRYCLLAISGALYLRCVAAQY